MERRREALGFEALFERFDVALVAGLDLALDADGRDLVAAEDAVVGDVDDADADLGQDLPIFEELRDAPSCQLCFVSDQRRFDHWVCGQRKIVAGIGIDGAWCAASGG